MRRTDREVKDEEKIREILEHAQVVHIGMVEDGRPYVVPMHYGYLYENGVLTLYTHGAKEGRKSNVIEKNSQVFIEIETDVVDVSGGDIPCNYGSSYASIMGDGEAEIVTDIAKKTEALQILMRTQTKREFVITEQMAENVQVFRIVVPHITAKCRPKMQ